MKAGKIFCMCAAAAVAAAFTSCKPEEVIEENVVLKASPTAIEAPGRSKESFKVLVETVGPWLAEANADFVSLSPTWSIGNTEMTITVEKNRTDAPRSAEVTITIDGAEPVTIRISQEAGVIEEIGQRKFYVKVDGSEEADGLTWSGATTFDKAYEEAVEGEEIHVAAGIYCPTTVLSGADAGEPRNKTFFIDKNITVIGGYSANPVAGETPDWKTNKTVFSGKLADGSSVWHTMVVGAPVSAEGRTATMKGLYISDGNAAGSPTPSINGQNLPAGRAGGIVVSGNTNVIFEDCEISSNYGNECGAVCINLNKEGSVTFNRCLFLSNEATGTNAGAIGSTKSRCFIYDCTFDSNKAKSNGGGIMIDGHWSQTTGDQTYMYVYNSTFINNECGGAGSAFYGIWGDHAAIVNCTFSGNRNNGDWGAVAIHIGELDIVNTTISSNYGKKCGGLAGKNDCTIRVWNSIISGNTSDLEGSEDIAYENASLAKISLATTITGNTMYDASGSSSSCLFDPASMLDALADNGGETMTMALKGESNPAVSGGLGAEQLAALAPDTIVPVKDASILSKDQRGENRTGRHMGACAK